jgi:hypothetical protein
LSDGVTGNTSDFGSEESRFETWSDNKKITMCHSAKKGKSALLFFFASSDHPAAGSLTYPGLLFPYCPRKVPFLPLAIKAGISPVLLVIKIQIKINTYLTRKSHSFVIAARLSCIQII